MQGTCLSPVSLTLILESGFFFLETVLQRGWVGAGCWHTIYFHSQAATLGAQMAELHLHNQKLGQRQKEKELTVGGCSGGTQGWSWHLPQRPTPETCPRNPSQRPRPEMLPQRPCPIGAACDCCLTPPGQRWAAVPVH